MTELVRRFRCSEEEIKCPRCQSWATGKGRNKYKWYGNQGDLYDYTEMHEPIMIALAKHASECIHQPQKLMKPPPPPTATRSTHTPMQQFTTNSSPPPPPPERTGLNAEDGTPVAEGTAIVVGKVVEDNVDNICDMIDEMDNLDELLTVSERCVRRMQFLREAPADI